MTDDQHIHLDLNAEVDSYFDASSECENRQPVFAMVMGGAAVGKTTTRRYMFSKGYVLVDAADIFIRLSKGQSLDFPDDLKEPMEIVGAQIARRAVAQRRHIVTELMGADYESTVQLIEAMRSIGYETSLHWVTCNVEEAVRRNMARGNDNISCYFAEEFQRRWLMEASNSEQNPPSA